MILWVARFIAPVVGERFARIAAWIMFAVLLAGAVWVANGLYDRSVILDFTEEAREDFDKKQGQAEKEAGVQSEDRRVRHAERVRTTEELIDEAVTKGCSVGEYLATGGDRCL